MRMIGTGVEGDTAAARNEEEERCGSLHGFACNALFIRESSTLFGKRLRKVTAARRASSVRCRPMRACTRRASRSSVSWPTAKRCSCSAIADSAAAKSPEPRPRVRAEVP